MHSVKVSARSEQPRNNRIGCAVRSAEDNYIADRRATFAARPFAACRQPRTNIDCESAFAPARLAGGASRRFGPVVALFSLKNPILQPRCAPASL